MRKRCRPMGTPSSEPFLIVDVLVGGFDPGNLFAGEIGGKPARPELVLPLDFALHLGSGRRNHGECVGFEEAKIPDAPLNISA